MRNYWMRIALGAVAIFAVGMIGVSLVQAGRRPGARGGAGQRPVGDPPRLRAVQPGRQQAGHVDKLTLFRDAPKRISAVEIHIKLRIHCWLGAGGMPSGGQPR